ncbi:PIG-L deacetylase family protein [Hansschlegelia zhihuaiae]|uniref:PIG-L family deacetylase n=1 Tax=Hansschlegelia zhihuaiae TaxID=405005 RepID=A0A4V1KIJ7_9HYPH|nr:PIG-L deacetylase family protein [Hansschlegelia zhihuaiae]RXF70932.1 PIG-L family deacetylase [Hansschlegelia zhihuaiae]
MRPLRLLEPREGRLSILCLGAHSDDIEIGAGGALLHWIASGLQLDVTWCVLSAAGTRAAEATESAASFLEGAARSSLEMASFTDGFLPQEGRELKQWFEDLKGRVDPDLILTHTGDDAHQDHRMVQQLTWNTFRDHFILEYEIPKWDGDLGRPNIYVPLSSEILNKKIELLQRHFTTQRSKHWFEPDTFRALAQLRGNECRATERTAEAFHMRKARLS